MRILFQGDSITDCGRDRSDFWSLGSGYPGIVDAMIKVEAPQAQFEIINRGISGDRTGDLRKRWVKDCIELEPDIVSILVGINDVWRRYDSNDPTSLEDFSENYQFILSEISKNLEGAKIVILEPFLVDADVNKRVWREDLDPKIQVIRKLALEYSADYIPLDGLFAKATIESAIEGTRADMWAQDGVHPTQAGHFLIAKEWLKIL